MLTASGMPAASGAEAASSAPASAFDRPDRISASDDLDGDGISERYLLEDHTLTVTEGSQKLWISPAEYTIDYFALGDIDNDGTLNLVFSLWKTGSFGRNHPFWHTGSDESYKNHLFLYKLREDTFKQAWCSSDLDHPILSFEIRDINDDGENELVTLEGEYIQIAGERFAADPEGSKQTTKWKWGGWGFQRL